MSSESKTRIITASILLFAVLTILLVANNFWFDILLSLLILLGAWEWTNLVALSKIYQKFIFILLIALAISSAYYFAYWVHFGLVFWLAAFIWLPHFPDKTRGLFNKPWLNALAGILILVPAWQALYFLHDERILILFLLLIIWAADIGAYFSGRKFGKTRLAPRVSPGKTTEGAIGGLILAFIIALIFLSFRQSPVSLLIIVPIVAISIVGDLTISAYKREAKIKDSSNILPGHGGILDRIDSLLAAAPWFYILRSYE